MSNINLIIKSCKTIFQVIAVSDILALSIFAAF